MKCTKEELVALLENGFNPYVCIVKFSDYGNAFDFEVRAGNGECLTGNLQKRTKDFLTNKKRLLDLVDMVRQSLIEKGYKFS